jgi:pilus assembly protein CpaF
MSSTGANDCQRRITRSGGARAESVQVIAPASVNIRKFVVRATHLDDVVALGTLSPTAARFLGAAVSSGLNVLVSGGTQAGKTTLLNCLSAAIPGRERVVTCEEVFELKIAG